MAEGLARRRRWADAERLLSRVLPGTGTEGSRVSIERRPWEILARAALENGNPARALAVLEKLPRDPLGHAENARIHLLALERSGRTAEALEVARYILELSPGEPVVQAALERLDVAAPDPGLRSADPLFTVARAERYLTAGRTDRAVRVYRRLLLAARLGVAGAASDPSAVKSLQRRLSQILGEGVDLHLMDDLSEELVDPSTLEEAPAPEVAPPPLAMPDPSLRSAVGEEASPERGEPEPAGPERPEPDIADLATTEAAPPRSAFPVLGIDVPLLPLPELSESDPDSEETERRGGWGGGQEGGARLGERRKRRSLLHR